MSITFCEKIRGYKGMKGCIQRVFIKVTKGLLGVVVDLKELKKDEIHFIDLLDF